MKVRTPVSSVILYLFGIIFMIVAAFMLVTAISYTKLYLASYDTTFSEMWSNSLQYIIGKFLPYFAAGVLCLGLGKAISVFKKGQAAQTVFMAGPEGQDAKATPGVVMTADGEEIALSLKELREVGSIKLEEMERREKVRLDDMRETVSRDMAIHRLQREAKEEEIISKLNAMGEKLGLDMADLYAKADIPVVPEYHEEKTEEEDKLKDDPLFEELEKKEEAQAEEQVEETPAEEETTEGPAEEEPVEEPVEETPEEDPVEEEPAEEEAAEEEPVEEETAEEETAEEPAEEETAEEPAEEEATEEEPAEEEPVEETTEEDVVEEEPAEEEPAEEEPVEEETAEEEPAEEESAEEEPAEEAPAEDEAPAEEEAPAEDEAAEEDAEDHSDEQVLTHKDEPGKPQHVEKSRRAHKKKQKNKKRNKKK